VTCDWDALSAGYVVGWVPVRTQVLYSLVVGTRARGATSFVANFGSTETSPLFHSTRNPIRILGSPERASQSQSNLVHVAACADNHPSLAHTVMDAVPCTRVLLLSIPSVTVMQCDCARSMQYCSPPLGSETPLLMQLNALIGRVRSSICPRMHLFMNVP
jgi:hypothetical protein